MELLLAHSSYPITADRLQDLLTLPRRPEGAVASVRSPRRRTSRRVTPDELEAMVTAYRSGQTLTQIAAEHHRSKNGVSAALKRAGVQVRYNLLGDADVAEAARLYESGLSLAEVGARFEVDASTVHRAFVRAGIATRPRRGQ